MNTRDVINDLDPDSMVDVRPSGAALRSFPARELQALLELIKKLESDCDYAASYIDELEGNDGE